MKQIIVTLFLFVVFISDIGLCEDITTVYAEKNKFGLIKGKEIITEAKYSKLISLREKSYICMYKGKYGIISPEGKILVEPKFTSAQRFIGKYAKFGLKNKFVLYDENANLILDDNYSDIALLYGKMFLVKKNFKYGITSFDGKIILPPVADDIYMPKANVLKISLDGEWYEITQKNKGELEFPEEFDLVNGKDIKDFTFEKLVESPVASAGYGVVSASDYIIKIISSISPAYEETIDELILSHGVDTVNIIVKSEWLIKFPYVYAKNYINNLKAPNNGPLSDVKSSLKQRIKE